MQQMASGASHNSPHHVAHAFAKAKMKHQGAARRYVKLQQPYDIEKTLS
jgi:hypothetical protein